MGRLMSPRQTRRRFWRLIRAGVLIGAAGVQAGVSVNTARAWFRQAGGMPPMSLAEPSGRYLSLTEREEIACARAAGQGVREIARALRRDPSTISRELRRGVVRRRTGYRATVAQDAADRRACRPRARRLETDPRLRSVVEDKLRRRWSPEQIAKWLAVTYPDDPGMRVSHEAIYQALYVQGRGLLRRELAACLRTGRASRRPRGRPREVASRHRIPGIISISERPAEADDRAVPGHWEGDLITGHNNASAIGTLVERTTRYTMLLHLPGRHGAEEVRDAMVAKIGELPAHLWRSLAWDRGSEMAKHLEISVASGLPIYFCDPASPWQRGSNENTNGLLRQYFPKGSDLSAHTAEHLDRVADELNTRPRKTLGWKTPAEALAAILSADQPTGVATTP